MSNGLIKFKKSIYLSVLLFSAISLAGCVRPENLGQAYVDVCTSNSLLPNDPGQLIVGFYPGGQTDLNLRIKVPSELQTPFEDQLWYESIPWIRICAAPTDFTPTLSHKFPTTLCTDFGNIKEIIDWGQFENRGEFEIRADQFFDSNLLKVSSIDLTRYNFWIYFRIGHVANERTRHERFMEYKTLHYMRATFDIQKSSLEHGFVNLTVKNHWQFSDDRPELRFWSSKFCGLGVLGKFLLPSLFF